MGVTSDTCISNHADRESRGKRAKTAAKSSSKEFIALSARHSIVVFNCKSEKAKLTFLEEDDSDDESIDTKDTSHDDGHDTLNDHVWLEHSHGGDSNAGLSSTVRSAEAFNEVRHVLFSWKLTCKSEGESDSEVTKEGS